jgi:hypothetical protein
MLLNTIAGRTVTKESSGQGTHPKPPQTVKFKAGGSQLVATAEQINDNDRFSGQQRQFHPTVGSQKVPRRTLVSFLLFPGCTTSHDYVQQSYCASPCQSDKFLLTDHHLHYPNKACDTLYGSIVLWVIGNNWVPDCSICSY